jgi:hypothetical protein
VRKKVAGQRESTKKEWSVAVKHENKEKKSLAVLPVRVLKEQRKHARRESNAHNTQNRCFHGTQIGGRSRKMRGEKPKMRQLAWRHRGASTRVAGGSLRLYTRETRPPSKAVPAAWRGVGTALPALSAVQKIYTL